MHSKFHLLIALLSFIFQAPLPSLASTPTCGLSIKLSASSKAVTAGKSVIVTARVANRGGQTLNDLNFQFRFPDYLTPLEAKSFFSNAAPPSFYEQYVYTLGVTLPPGKAFKVRVKAGVPACQQPGAVAVDALAYVLDSLGAVACSTSPASKTLQVRPTKKNEHSFGQSKRNVTYGQTCITPTPAPATTFELVAPLSRCLEAEQIPVTRLRHLAHGANQGTASSSDLQATSTISPVQCYDA